MFLETLQAVTGLFVVVYDGQHAVKFTLGRAVGIVGPGVHMKWPIFQKFRVEPTKFTTLDLEAQTIQLRDELVYMVGAKVVYQIVDLMKAMIEVDNLVEGLRNRLVLAVQRVVKSRDRLSITDANDMIDEVRQQMKIVEEQWGIRIIEFGFSTFSPSPETLEVTQLRMMAEEKLRLFHEFTKKEGLSAQAAVSLISGAVVAVRDIKEEVQEELPPRKEEDKSEKEEKRLEIPEGDHGDAGKPKGDTPPTT
jgi:regulator of protease activity HflC (stomatin/prohibitin superfamily)